MAGEDAGASDGAFGTATWRVVLLFGAILVIDTLWEFANEWVTHSIRRRKSKGLMHAWEQLKFEVMALGLVSLLLVVFEVRAHR